jgi:hypothetical protein
VEHVYESFQTVLLELDQRFNKHQHIAIDIINLIPSTVIDKTISDVQNMFNFYQTDLPSSNLDVITAEFEMWQQKWKKNSTRRPTVEYHTILNALIPIKSFCPNLNCLFEVFAILPVTVATAERSFSTMKRIKTTVRNSIGDKRLSNLALIYIRRDITTNLSVEDIINIFCKDQRRIKFTN